MKTKTTNKFINAMYNNVFYVMPGDLNSLYKIMYGESPVYYNCGVYGWNYDCYINYETDTAIMHGYRNMTGKKADSEILKKYADKAEKIIDRINWKWETRQKHLNEIRKKCFYELVKKDLAWWETEH